MLLVPTDAAHNPIIGTDSSEDSAYLPVNFEIKLMVFWELFC